VPELLEGRERDIGGNAPSARLRRPVVREIEHFDFGCQVPEAIEGVPACRHPLADHLFNPRHVLHGPELGFQVFDNFEELDEVLESFSQIAAPAAVRIGEFGAGRTPDHQFDVLGQVIELQLADIHRLEMPTKIGIVRVDRRPPPLIGRDHFDTSELEPEAPPPNPGIKVNCTHGPPSCPKALAPKYA